MTDETPRQLQGRRGFYVSYKGKTLLSRVDSIGQGERAAAAFPKSKRTLYLCPSPLYGYGLALFLDALDGDSAVLCVEADEQLLELSRRAMGELLADPRLGLLPAAGEEELCAYVRDTWGARRFRRVELLRLTGGWQLFPARYEALAAVLRRRVTADWGNAMTLVKLGRRYARNALQNLALIPRAPSLGALSFDSAPVLVLGAGPSLDGLLAGLRDTFGAALEESAQRPFRIVAVDTALPPLLDRNIRPDLVAALECQHWNLRDFIGAAPWKIPAAMDLSALPATAEALGGPVCLFATPWTGLALFRRLSAAALLPVAMPPLGSVGLTAVALACRLSRGIILVGGLDFSFTPDAYHARGTAGHRDRLQGQDRFHGIINASAAFRRGSFRTLAKTGVPVWSDPALRSYRDLFEGEFARESRVRDIAGPGLPLGVPALSLAEALACLRAQAGGLPGPQGPDGEGERRGGDSPGEFPPPPPHGSALAEKTAAFVRGEREALRLLREILSGTAPPPPPDRFEALLDEEDYLWAHFPDCAAAGGRRPPATDLSFLKRVRVELDPFIGLLDRILEEISGGSGCLARGRLSGTALY
ncbi:MAG: DUF115 domain-containing protein [Treponema sp.]|jgi:hypothetical protein|nr:DUF115 domain-containing protein [Treponema sp.]